MLQVFRTHSLDGADWKSEPRLYRRKFDHDLARAMRAEGAKLADIAKEFGVTFHAVSKVTRGVPCPIDHIRAAASARVAEARAKRSEYAAERHKRVKLMRKAGMQLRDIAAVTHFGLTQIGNAAAGVKPRTYRGQKSMAVAKREARIAAFQCPRDVYEAGLRKDYLDYCRLYGERKAISLCRELMVEATRP